MVKQKRKTRLDKGDRSSGGEFIGFGAFASTAAAPSPQAVLQWSPVYVGSDSQVSLVFQRIRQKRDGTTKAKALNELSAYFSNNDIPKKPKIQALSHFTFLYHSKLNYDSLPPVRTAAFSCLWKAQQALPKAWNTLLVEQNTELLGMMLCAAADPAAEVRTVALALVDEHHSDFVDMASWNAGIWTYVKRILSYARARDMHEALFARSTSSNDDDDNNKKQTSSLELTEDQRDALEEKYERIVATALGGLELWIRSKQHTPPEETLDWLWKHLASSKAPLRRKTYILLTTCCSVLPTFIYRESSALVKSLPRALGTEKDAFNVPLLLELLLVYLVHAPKQQQETQQASPSWTRWLPLDTTVTKPLSKMFKKACYGATANSWGPTLLPLMALLPAWSDYQIQLLASAWEGREQAIATVDRLAIVTAVAECTTFLLQRPTDQDEQAVQQVATIWSNALGAECLWTTGAANPAKTNLVKGLARDIRSFSRITESDHSDAALYQVQDWFWNETVQPVIADQQVSQVALTQLISQVATQERDTKTSLRPFHSILQSQAQILLSQYQDRSGSVPTPEAYQLLICLLDHCGAKAVLTANDFTTVEKFACNDVLRWIIIHTSTLSERADARMTQYDFELLRICMDATTDDSSIWQSILKEVIAAKCDLQLLVQGLAVLVKALDPHRIRCAVLDDLAIQIGTGPDRTDNEDPAEEVESVASDVSVDEKHKKASLFLHACAGVSVYSSVLLVGEHVITLWLENSCPPSASIDSLRAEAIVSPALETLMELVATQFSAFEEKDVEKVLLESWREGGDLWVTKTLQMLRKDTSRFGRLVPKASEDLQDLLKNLCSKAGTSLDLSEACFAWSERALRLLDLCSQSGDAEGLFVPSLAMTGLSDVELWEERSGAYVSVLYHCLMFLFRNYQSPLERLGLLQNGVDDTTEVVTRILLALSEASGNAMSAELVKRRQDRCAHLLSALGGKEIERGLLSRWCFAILKKMETATQENTPPDSICKGVAVLSQILRDLLPTVEWHRAWCSSDELVAQNIKNGDTVDYIPDKEKPEVRECAVVVKVHTDELMVPYFTIRLDQEGGPQERQTVVERLRKRPTFEIDTKSVPLESLSADELLERESLAEAILKAFRSVSSLKLPWNSSAAELVNIIVWQCGVGKQRGLGSRHRELSQIVYSQILELRQDQESLDADQEGMANALWGLSLACGFGLNTPSYRHNLGVLGIDPSETVQEIASFYVAHSPKVSIELSRAILSLLIVTTEHLKNRELQADAFLQLFKISGVLLRERGKGLWDNHILALRGIYGAALHSPLDSNFATAEAEAYTELVRAFVQSWEVEETERDLFALFQTGDQRWDRQQIWRSLPYFSSILKSGIETGNGAFVSACRRNAGDLVDVLFVECKRWYALQLMDLVASTGNPLLDGDSSMNDLTSKRLQTWVEDLDSVEGEELEEDVDIVNRWVPAKLLNEVEAWYVRNDALADGDDEVSIGRMLAWLCLLRFVESAAPKDSRNRPAFTSYVERCGAIHPVLQLAVTHANLGSDRNSDAKCVTISLADLLVNEEFMDMPRIASTVLFRTVEVFPTLSRRWWESDCPKFKIQPVKDFVEANVAPETLRDELSRINGATAFGAMKVTGSSVSREVTATYSQDDFQLSVVIRIPRAFPFRSAEVDCSRTLGVPESRWKRWALQITLMLNNQGGTLQDALMLWKENVDKEFEGVEPCPVCYSVLHVKTHKLPKLECTTCRNRFHADCLSQWFRSSGKNQCVLCQQPWNGTRVQ